MILTKPQADAVYDAMCVLNNVGGVLHIRILTEGLAINVEQFLTDEVRIWYGSKSPKYVKPEELYDSQSDFAKAYGVE